MEAHATTPAAHGAHHLGALTVATIIGAAVLSGLGIMGVMYWLLTFKWVYFLSIGLVIVGAYLMFTRATGPDHA